MSHLDEGVRIQGFYDRSNLEVVDMPRRETSHGRPADTVPVHAVGQYIAHRLEERIAREMDASQEFAWQSGNVLGLKLLDPVGEKQIKELVKGLANARDQKSYYDKEVRNFLYGLRPAARPKEGVFDEALSTPKIGVPKGGQ